MTNFYDKNGEQIKAGDTLLFESENEIFEIKVVDNNGVLGWISQSSGEFYQLCTYNRDTGVIDKTTIKK